MSGAFNPASLTNETPLLLQQPRFPTVAKSPTMVSLAPYVLKRPWLSKLLMPVANWYVGATGYRALGLK